MLRASARLRIVQEGNGRGEHEKRINTKRSLAPLSSAVATTPHYHTMHACEEAGQRAASTKTRLGEGVRGREGGGGGLVAYLVIFKGVHHRGVGLPQLAMQPLLLRRLPDLLKEPATQHTQWMDRRLGCEAVVVTNGVLVSCRGVALQRSEAHARENGKRRRHHNYNGARKQTADWQCVPTLCTHLIFKTLRAEAH